MIKYKDFLKTNISLAPLGIEPPSEHFVPYFCTPKGYSLIGSLGVDGIHFVFSRGHGETVFVVTPMGDMPYCHPIANNFDHFLRLLLAVGDAGFLDTVYAFGAERLEKFKSELIMSDEATKTVAELTALGLEPMPDPCTYASDIHGSFNFDTLKFTDEYYETVGDDIPTDPVWEVNFGGNKKYPCAEVPCDVNFTWRGCDFKIPAYYTSKKGIAVDIFTSVKTEVLKEFEEKLLAAETEDERDLIAEESPTNLHITLSSEIDGVPQNNYSAHMQYYSPDLSLSFIPHDRMGELAVDHYGLDESTAHIMIRAEFANNGRTAQKFNSVKLIFKDEPVIHAGDKFTLDRAGDELTVRSPVDGILYTLRAENITEEKVPEMPFSSYEKFPSCVVNLQYSITPSLSRRAYILRDTVSGDAPIKIKNDSASASAIGIIGGADGPTAVLFGKPAGAVSDTEYRSAVSNPRYSFDIPPVWQIFWRGSTAQPTTVILK